MSSDVHTSIYDADAIDPAPIRTGRSRSVRSEPGIVQSVDRALSLLEALSRPAAQPGTGAALTDLAAQAGLNVSTCHHLLATLMKWGYVAKVPGRRTYALGARGLHLGQSFLRQVDLPRRAQPVLQQLNATTGEAVHLAVLQGDTVVTVAKLDAHHAVRVDTGAIGVAEAAHATATGKAMLAWLPEDQMRRILAVHGMPRFTPSTITDEAALIEDLRHVRRNGFALDREECKPGVVCVGAAVRDHTGALIGSISVSAPAFRATDSHFGTMRGAVIAAARTLSAEFGASGATSEDSVRQDTSSGHSQPAG